jgi:inner membrane protein
MCLHGGLLSALYVLLYGILQLEDYALLMGTGLLLVVLMALMYLTRHLRAAIPAK